MKKQLIILMMGMGLSLAMYGQYNLDSAKVRLYRINELFDSANHFAFDVKIVYATDTIYGKFNYEELDGSYIYSGRNMYYKMGSSEFIQNDSFMYNIDHDDKLILMARNEVGSNDNLFPLKNFLDSTLSEFDTAYLINLHEDSVQSILSFTAKFDSLPYRYFAISYDSSSFYPYKYEMEFYDGGDESDTVFLVSDSVQKSGFTPPKVKRRISFTFSNYHTVGSLAVFENSEYIYFNREIKGYEPADRLVGYRLITNGFDDKDARRHSEIYPPPKTDPPL